jgi:oligoendopeptidase F
MHDQKVLITCESQFDSMALLAIPKIGSWNLNDLVKDPNGNEFQEFLQHTEAIIDEVEGKRKDLDNHISVSDFENLLHLIENISERISIASGYAHLKYSADTSCNETASLVTRMEQLESDVANRLLFFDLWFKKGIDEQNAKRLIESLPVEYREYLKHKRLLARHTLTELEEKIISIMEVTGINALVKIYDRMTNGFEFVMTIKKGKKTVKKKFSNKEKMLSLIRGTNSEERKAAYKSLLHVYKKNSGVLGEIYLNRVIQWRDEAVKLRGFKSPLSVRNVFNNLDDSTVDVLLETCRQNSGIFHEYFKEKAKMLGLKKLQRYHLYAPLSLNSRYQKRFTYSKAVDIMLNTFEEFDPQFREFSERVFNEQHVDSAIRKNKQGGAFCSTIIPKKTPYVLLNFDGKSRDVSTMAHEFGHAIHSLAASDKPFSVSHAPLPLAETASVFAEMLLNERLYKNIKNKERKILLGEQIDDMYATIMRQAYFTLFEIDAHKIITEQSATIDQVSELYFSNLKEQFGDSVDISLEFKWEWLYIPHFYHTPFYCYAYCFGNLLVMSLYQQFKKEGSSFVQRYLKILSAGGSRKPEELLQESGIDISQHKFWQQGFDLVSKKIQEFRDMGL